MTHTSTEQPEALRVAAWLITAPQKTTIGDMILAGRELRRLHARVQELEAAQVQRVTPEIAKHVNALTEIARMPNAEYVADAHNNAVRYLRGITQEKQG